MDLLDFLRAKSDDEQKNSSEILLKEHLYLTIEKALQLKKFITDNRETIAYDRFNDEFFRSLLIACLLHDLGKINLNFQRKLFRRDTKEFNAICDLFRGYKDIDVADHEVISTLYSLLFNNNNEWDKKIRTAILLHHYNDFYTNKDLNARNLFDEYPDLSKYLKFMKDNKDKISQLLESLLEYIRKRLEETNNLTDDINQLFKMLHDNIEKGYCYIEQLYNADRANRDLSTILEFFNITDEDNSDLYDFFVFLGALRRCDYAASANTSVELQIKTSDLYSGLEKKIRDKIGGISTASLWQEELINRLPTKQNIVLIAPTGSGKTEFALLWASKKGKKLIYTLPLRVALNDLYWRLGNIEKGYFDNAYLNILHSTSFIEYIKVQDEGKEGRYGMVDIEIKHNAAKLFSSPILLTTPDQVFLTSLKYYSCDKLINIYPLSTVVIDEVQAYKPEMVAIILKTIDIIQRLQGDVIIITATFPPYFEEFFKDKFDIIDISKYNDIKERVKNYNQKRHLIHVLDYALFNQNKDNRLEVTEKALRIIREQLENRDKNILIIVNNVSKAILLYEKLKEIKETIGGDVYLLHSRLLEKEKSIRIKKIKTGGKRIVLVATQIVEASVDIDFDILITEISPIDSQIQRWGRIYRNRKSDYTSSEPNIIIFTTCDKGATAIDKGTTAIYDKQVTEQTIHVLRENDRKKIMSYEDELDIIKQVYNTSLNGKTLKDIYVEEIKKNLDYLKYFTVERKSHAQRLFREIASLQLIIPAIMSNSDNDIERRFAELIENEGNNLSWSEIIDKIREQNKSTNLDIWYFKHILYDYSISLPLFLLEKLLRRRGVFDIKEFKGYYILNIRDKNNYDAIIEDIIEYGLDKVLERIDISTYNSEIEISENII